MALDNIRKPLDGVLDSGVVILAGNCAIGATGAVGAVTGTGVTPTRTATGDYTLTIAATGGIPFILSADVSLEEDADVGYVVGKKVSTAGAGTVTATVYTAAASTTPADPPSGSFLHWVIYCKNSSVTR